MITRLSRALTPCRPPLLSASWCRLQTCRHVYTTSHAGARTHMQASMQAHMYACTHARARMAQMLERNVGEGRQLESDLFMPVGMADDDVADHDLSRWCKELTSYTLAYATCPHTCPDTCLCHMSIHMSGHLPMPYINTLVHTLAYATCPHTCPYTCLCHMSIHVPVSLF